MRLFLLTAVLLTTFSLKAQVLDEIVGMVGDKIILRSELELDVLQVRKQEENLPPDIYCELLNQKMIEKLFLHKADLDSVVVDEERVSTELDRRMRRVVEQFGSEKALENYYGKTIAEIKSSSRDKVRDNLLVQEMQQKVLKDVKVSPTDVKKLFNEIPADSLPFYSAEVEVAQIIKLPQVNAAAKTIALSRCKEIRDRILAGEEFKTLAVLYSDDPASAAKGGELGYFGRGMMVPEFEAAAFKLKGDTVSKIVETKFGYHILQLIDRKGDNINIRHILIRPQTTSEDLIAARNFMDSLYNKFNKDSVNNFTELAKKVSDDEETKGNGGFLRDPSTGSTRVNVELLDKALYLTVQKMKAGEISEPELVRFPDGTQAYRILYLRSESAPHKANLRDDYQKFQAMAFERKQQEAIGNWVEKHRKKYFVKVSDQFMDCKTMERWKNIN